MISYLTLSEFVASSRVCCSWRVASLRKTAWPFLSDMQQPVSFTKLHTMPRCVLHLAKYESWTTRVSQLLPGVCMQEVAIEQRWPRTHPRATEAMPLPAVIPLRLLTLATYVCGKLNEAVCFRSLASTLLILRLDVEDSMPIWPHLRLLTNLQTLSLHLLIKDVELLPYALHPLQHLHSLCLRLLVSNVCDLYADTDKGNAFLSILQMPPLRRICLVGAWRMEEMTVLMRRSPPLQLTHVCFPTPNPFSVLAPSRVTHYSFAEQVPQVKHLEIRELRDTRSLLSWCKQLSRLQHLDIVLSESITLACVQALVALPHLKSFHLRSYYLAYPAFFPDAPILYALAHSTQWRSLTYIADVRTMMLLRHHLDLLQKDLDEDTSTRLQSFRLLLEPTGILERTFYRFAKTNPKIA
jgi:hypothetical protein